MNTNEQYANFENEFKGVEAIITPEELKNIFLYIRNMEDSMKKLSSELDSLKSKMDSQEEVKSKIVNPIANTGNKSVMKFSNKIDFADITQEILAEMQELMMGFKESILEKATDIKICVHEKNLEGLNVIVSKLHLGELSEKMSKALEKAIEKTKDLMGRIEYVESEIGEIKGHLKNIKDPIMPSNTNAADVQFKFIKNCVSNQSKLLSRMKEKNDNFYSKVTTLDNDVEKNRLQSKEKKMENLSKASRLKDRTSLPLSFERV